MARFIVNSMSREGISSDELQYILDRSCLVHCVAVVDNLQNMRHPSFDRIEEYVDFLITNGANQLHGTSNPEMYDVNDGWIHEAVVGLLRINGHLVVRQNLQYDAKTSDFSVATQNGRISNDAEAKLLEELIPYGGEKGENWLEALQRVLKIHGNPVVSIVIPSSKKEGHFGRHTVVVEAVTDTDVVFFDPDELILDRYKEGADAQQIVRQDPEKLVYAQPRKLFLARMTGEVINIFPPTG
jgi:hypothetical protein